ncbi:MAG: hypothetical protein ACRECY_16065, partial [Phyllobacterium sp.]
MPAIKSVPTSTYRLLLRNGITFQHVVAIVPYFTQLCAGSLSISSVFDTHDAGGGRRAFDPTLLDRKSGGEYGFAVLNQALKAARMPLIIDINPNQSATSHDSLWWRSVLEWGEEGHYASHFDIDWQERLNLPILERPLAEEIQAGRLTLTFDVPSSGLGISYSNDFLPLSPRSYAIALDGIDNDLAGRLRKAASQAAASRPDGFHQDLALAYRSSTLTQRLELAARFSQILKDPVQFQALLSSQYWQLITASQARHRLNYRHSYDSFHSAGVRVEVPAVFDDFHEAALELLGTTQISGFRVNQVDGLSFPSDYLQQLRRKAGKRTYLVTDKILLDHERHPDDWLVQGTAGYEFISAVSNVLVDHTRIPVIEQLYARIIGSEARRGGHYTHAKSAILHKKFAPELHSLARLLHSIAPDAPDELETRHAISEAIIGLPVFRTYATPAESQDSHRSIF